MAVVAEIYIIIRLIADRQNDENALRQKTNFPSRFKLIWVVQSCREKYFAFRITQITSILRPSRPT